MHSLRELAQNRTIVPLEYFLEKVVWSEAQLPLVRPNELEVVPPSPPLIIISDASSDETVAPLDSPAEETADPPASPVGGIADLFDSSSGEVVALTDFPV
ncbi:hypothetical protein glysoja_039071 [Glycine soja]|uniref:Uncharacterized protein n=1 Tax=Glycine soja TaxID=3848 RepID=A0A0B2NTT1_GLYSO|nr:hypothetical protein glysoja_039071 [Glycine soja]